MAFSILGAYVLVYSVPSLIKMIAISVLPPLSDQGGTLIRTRVRVEDIAQEVAKTGIGVCLLFGWRRLVDLLRSMWKKGISAGSPE